MERSNHDDGEARTMPIVDALTPEQAAAAEKFLRGQGAVKVFALTGHPSGATRGGSPTRADVQSACYEPGVRRGPTVRRLASPSGAQAADHRLGVILSRDE
jgi:hypothetical protein